MPQPAQAVRRGGQQTACAYYSGSSELATALTLTH